MKITNIVRNAVRSVLADSASYNADTMVIGRDGMVTACRDADKTFSAPETGRCTVCHVEDMVTADGRIREGY